MLGQLLHALQLGLALAKCCCTLARFSDFLTFRGRTDDAIGEYAVDVQNGELHTR
jgi:hypothetical protein